MSDLEIAANPAEEEEKPQRWMLLMVVEQGEGEGKPEHWDWNTLTGSRCWPMASLPVVPGEDMYVALEKDTGWLVTDRDGDPVWE